MLLQFSVTNFKSLKQQSILSLFPSKDKELPENIIVDEKERALKVISLYGANAAGKSNLFGALTAAILFIRDSNVRQVGVPFPLIVPFKFDPVSSAAPTVFEVVFMTGGSKFVYRFSANTLQVFDEVLYVYKAGRANLVFERTDTTRYRFTNPEFKKQLSPLIERNTENKLFLATATAWNCEVTRAPFMWFMNGINTYPSNYDELLDRVGPAFEADTENKLNDFAVRLMREGDINISGLKFSSREIPYDKLMEQVPQPIRTLLPHMPTQSHKQYSVQMSHSIVGKDGYKDYELSVFEESSGTRHLFLLSPVLKKAFETGETVCIDEFDTSFHPELVEFLVSLFYDPEINKAHAQLIISTHTTVLLSSGRLRRDQIYFVEKDRETGVSELYSLDEYKKIKGEDIEKSYLIGRFGAVPDLKGGASLK